MIETKEFYRGGQEHGKQQENNPNGRQHKQMSKSSEHGQISG
jgi:hypothetical protein